MPELLDDLSPNQFAIRYPWSNVVEGLLFWVQTFCWVWVSGAVWWDLTKAEEGWFWYSDVFGILFLVGFVLLYQLCLLPPLVYFPWWQSLSYRYEAKGDLDLLQRYQAHWLSGPNLYLIAVSVYFFATSTGLLFLILPYPDYPVLSRVLFFPSLLLLAMGGFQYWYIQNNGKVCAARLKEMGED